GEFQLRLAGSLAPPHPRLFLLKHQFIIFDRDLDFIAPPSRTLRRDKPGLNGLPRARSLGLAAFVPQSGTNGAPALANCCPSEGLLLRNSQTFRQWAPSCQLSRPRGLCPAARDKSFSPFPKRLKSQTAQVAFEQAHRQRIENMFLHGTLERARVNTLPKPASVGAR